MSYNRCVFVGRLVRTPEKKVFNGGGAVTKFSLAVDAERKKNQATGKWESVPAFIDCEAFNRGEHGKTADMIEQYCEKGSQILVETHVKQESWTSQDGTKRNKLVFVVDEFRFVGSKGQSEGSASNNNWASQARAGATEKPQGEPQFAPDGNPEDVPF